MRRPGLLACCLLLADSGAAQSCPAISASTSTPIKEVLASICRRDDCAAVQPPAECVDCSMVPSLLEILIAEEEEGSAEGVELTSAQHTLTFLCDACVAPIFAHIIAMDEPGAPPFPDEQTFASACGSAVCLNRYRELAQTHAAGSAGKTMVLFNDIKLTCAGRHPDKALATRQVRDLLAAIDGGGVSRSAGRLRAELHGAARRTGRLLPEGVSETAASPLAAGKLQAGTASLAAFAAAFAAARAIRARAREPQQLPLV